MIFHPELTHITKPNELCTELGMPIFVPRQLISMCLVNYILIFSGRQLTVRGARQRNTEWKTPQEGSEERRWAVAGRVSEEREEGRFANVVLLRTLTK